MSAEIDSLRRYDGWKLVVAFALTVVVIFTGLVLGGEWEHVASSAWVVAPFSVLAVFSYLGIERLWARALTIIILAVIILGAGLTTILLTLIVLTPELITQPDIDPSLLMSSLNLNKLALACCGIGLAVLIATSAFIPRVRQVIVRLLPLNPHSFVHTVAMVAVVGLTLISFVPLHILSTPPLLSFTQILLAQGEDLTGGRGSRGMLLDEFYSLVWLVPGAILAVGYGVRRNFKMALERLGLQRPTWRQVIVGVGLAVVLVIVVGILSPCIDWVWDSMGWPKTDVKTFEQLMTHFYSPLGALVLGVVAGLGEELAVRGVLQPRFGVWLSNLFFTSLHAMQYNWDSLLIVFGVGLVLGVIRNKTNTTTSAIVHGTYDFLLIMAVIFQIPWFSE
jgi:membrane protease YdiL (CAAX protease family)